MRKIFYSIATIAAAAVALVSCQKEASVNADGLVAITINAGIPEFDITKTELNGTVINWSVNDALGITTGNAADAPNYKFTNKATEASATASFTGTTAIANNQVAYYPYSSEGIGTNGAKVNIKSSQKPSATSFDGTSDVLVSKPFSVAADTKEVSDLQFRRLTAVLKIILKDTDGALTGEKVKEVTVTSSATNLTGRAYVNFSEFAFGDLYSLQEKYVTVNPTAAYTVNGTNATYASVYPGTFAAGSTLTVSGLTDNCTFSREFTLANNIVFEGGKITTINVSLRSSDIETTTVTDYSGEWMLVGQSGENHYAMGAYASGNNIPAVAYTLRSDGKAVSENLGNSHYTVTKITEGTYAGMYTIKDQSGRALYAASSSANQMKASTTVTANSYWDITCDDSGKYTFKATKSSNRNVMQFNYNSGSPIFSCYTSASNSAVSLFPWADAIVQAVPVLTLSKTAVNLPYTAATNATIASAYTLKNAVDDDVTVTFDGNVTAASIAGGTVTYTISANTSTTATTDSHIILTLEGEAQTITLTQAKDTSAGGSDPMSYTWDLTAKSDDWTATGNATYFTQPYGFKAVNGTLKNSNITDFATPGKTKITCGFKCLQNGATTSKITIYLVDKDGAVLGSGVVVTPANASSAAGTKFQYAEFTENLSDATGFMMKVTTLTKNILVNGASYTIEF